MGSKIRVTISAREHSGTKLFWRDTDQWCNNSGPVLKRVQWTGDSPMADEQVDVPSATHAFLVVDVLNDVTWPSHQLPNLGAGGRAVYVPLHLILHLVSKHFLYEQSELNLWKCDPLAICYIGNNTVVACTNCILCTSILGHSPDSMTFSWVDDNHKILRTCNHPPIDLRVDNDSHSLWHGSGFFADCRPSGSLLPWSFSKRTEELRPPPGLCTCLKQQQNSCEDQRKACGLECWKLVKSSFLSTGSCACRSAAIYGKVLTSLNISEVRNKTFTFYPEGCVVSDFLQDEVISKSDSEIVIFSAVVLHHLKREIYHFMKHRSFL